MYFSEQHDGFNALPLGRRSQLDPNVYNGPDNRTQIEEQQGELLAQRIQNIIEIPIDIEQTELDEINRLISPLIVKPSEKAIENHAFSTHPRNFVYTFLCEYYLRKHSTEEIGPNMFKCQSGSHLACMKMDAREADRVSKAMFARDDFDARYNSYLRGGCCVDGAEKCTKNSSALVCSNVLYHLDMKHLFKLFKQKSVNSLLASMVFPKGLNERRSTYDPEHKTCFQMLGEGGKNALMTFHQDPSNGYLQDVDTWQEYMKGGIKDGRKYGQRFNLFFEHFKVIGNMHLIRITKTHLGASTWHTQLGDPSMVTIVDWTDLIAEFGRKLGSRFGRSSMLTIRGIARQFAKLPRFQIPVEIYSQVCAFLFNRPDDRVDRQASGAIIGSKMYQMIINSIVIQRGYTAGAGDYARIATLLLLKAWMGRTNSSKVIAHFAANVMKINPLGILDSLKELFYQWGISRDHLFAEEQRIKRFAELVMGTNIEQVFLCDLLLNDEKQPLEIYEAYAKKFNCQEFTFPDAREFVYDPLSDGFCYTMCVRKAGGETCIGPNPTEVQIEEDITRRGYESINLEISEGHCKLVTMTNEFCSHGVSKSLMRDDALGVQYDITDICDNHWIANHGSDNYNKTKAAFEIMGKPSKKDKILNGAAMPCNDELYWQETKRGKVLHWADTRYNDNRVLPIYEKNHTIVFDRNVFCDHCLSDSAPWNTLTKVFFDLGSGLDKRFHSFFYAKAMQNLRKWQPDAQIVVKVQDLKNILGTGKNRKFLIEMAHWTPLHIPELQANEYYMCYNTNAEASIVLPVLPVDTDGEIPPPPCVGDEDAEGCCGEPTIAEIVHEAVVDQNGATAPTAPADEAAANPANTAGWHLFAYYNQPVPAPPQAFLQAPVAVPTPAQAPAQAELQPPVAATAPPLPTIEEEDEDVAEEQGQDSDKNDDEAAAEADTDSSDDEPVVARRKRGQPTAVVKLKKCGSGSVAIVGISDISVDKSVYGASHNDVSPYGSGTAGAVDRMLTVPEERAAYEAVYRSAPKGFFKNSFGAWAWKSSPTDKDLLATAIEQIPDGATIPAVGTGQWDWRVGNIYAIIHHAANAASYGKNIAIYTKEDQVEALYAQIPNKEGAWCDGSDFSCDETDKMEIPVAPETRHFARDVTPTKIINGDWREGEYEPPFGNGLWDTPLVRSKPSPAEFIRSKYHPEGEHKPPAPVCFNRSDLARLILDVGITKLKEHVERGMLQYDDLEPSKYSDIPYDGRIVTIQNNRIYGPLYAEKPMLPHNAHADLGVYKKHMKQLSQELKHERQAKFKELHRDIGEIIEKGVAKTQFDFELIEGTYCSGKSYWLKKLIRERHGEGAGKVIRDYLIVCPSSALAREYKEEKFTAMSWSTAISAVYNLEQPVSIYIDEIFLLDPRVVLWFMDVAKNVVAVGDRRQMRPDIACLKNFDLANHITVVERHNIARSTPCDVVAMLNAEEPEKTYTRSKVVNSVVMRKFDPAYKGCQPDCKKKHDHVELFCFDNAHTARFCSRTIASIQGLRRKEVNIVATANSKALINDVRGQKLVALTRHTEKLVVHHSQGTQGIAKLLCPKKLGLTVGARDRFESPYGECEFQQVHHVPSERNDSKKQHDLFKIHHISEPIAVEPERPDIECLEVTAEERHLDEEPHVDIERLELEDENLVVEVDDVAPKCKLSRQALIEQAASVGGEVAAAAPLNYAVNLARSSTLLPFSAPVTKHEHTVAGMQETDEHYMGDAVEPICGEGDPTAATQVLAPVWKNQSRLADQRRFISVDKHRATKHTMRIKNQAHLVSDEGETSFVQYAKVFGVNQENNPNHQLATAVERYGKVKTASLSRKAREEKLFKLKKGFEKFVDVKKLRAPTPEEFSIVQTQAVLRAAAKRNQMPTGVYGETWKTISEIKCFNKQQLKAKGGDYAHVAIKEENGELFVKGGQMVSAQPKEVNQVAAAHVNWTERIIFGAMNDGVYPGYGASPRKLRKKIRARKIMGKNVVMSTDVSEQDTTKDEAVDDFMRWLYEMCGVPGHIVDAIEIPNKKWRMKNATVSMNVVNQMQSGRADTLLFNTCYTMALVGMSYEITHLKLALFQGDDCCVIAESIERTSDFFKNLKEERGDVGEFISFLVADNSLYLDIVRVAAKVLSKTWKDESRFEELRVAVKDGLGLNASFADRQNNILVAAHKHSLSVGDVTILYDYLHAFATPRDNALLKGMRSKAQAVVTQQLNTTWHFQ
ncbi:replicase [Wenzhou shrimp virus 3]|uniref:replicase n=1 Tax=Wenzhou shrimp virus 3 TaxID=1923650 RepID=UPI00090C876F|nr:replicase [Wenzhou shrimp virus 3]APG77704.1 replicase [Wenzhou shrimp virus 3]